MQRARSDAEQVMLNGTGSMTEGRLAVRQQSAAVAIVRTSKTLAFMLARPLLLVTIDEVHISSIHHPFIMHISLRLP